MQFNPRSINRGINRPFPSNTSHANQIRQEIQPENSKTQACNPNRARNSNNLIQIWQLANFTWLQTQEKQPIEQETRPYRMQNRTKSPDLSNKRDLGFRNQTERPKTNRSDELKGKGDGKWETNAYSGRRQEAIWGDPSEQISKELSPQRGSEELRRRTHLYQGDVTAVSESRREMTPWLTAAGTVGVDCTPNIDFCVRRRESSKCCSVVYWGGTHL